MSAATEFYNETAFVDAWQRGVILAGPRFFGTGGKPGLARSKWDLEPNYDMVERAMGVLSSGEAVFLAAMYSFYNARGAQQLLGRPLVPGEIAATLDEPRRRVIADLIVSYTGW
jgi:hypothetical protein